MYKRQRGNEDYIPFTVEGGRCRRFRKESWFVYQGTGKDLWNKERKP